MLWIEGPQYVVAETRYAPCEGIPCAHIVFIRERMVGERIGKKTSPSYLYFFKEYKRKEKKNIYYTPKYSFSYRD